MCDKRCHTRQRRDRRFLGPVVVVSVLAGCPNNKVGPVDALAEDTTGDSSAIDARYDSSPDLDVDPDDAQRADDAGPDSGAPGSSWLTVVGDSEGWASGYGLTIDGTGAVVITGGFGGIVKFGNIVVQEKAPHSWPKGEAFVAKLGPNGSFIWATQLAAGALNADGADVVADSADNLFVLGSYEGTMELGSQTVTSKGAHDVFVAKIDPAGNLVWVESFGGPDWDLGGGIAISKDEVFITGYIKSQADFGPVKLGSQGDTDIFVAKIDGNGKVVWASSAGGTGTDSSSGIAVDSSGLSYIAGHFQGQATFGSKQLSAGGSTAAVVARLDQNGQFDWASQAGGNTASAAGISLGAGGSLRVAGHFSGTAAFGSQSLVAQGTNDTFVANLDLSGNFVWATRVATGYGASIVADNTGIAYISGGLNPPAGSEDVLVAKVGPTGQVLGIIGAGGNDSDRGGGIALNSAGDVVLTGLLWSQGVGTFGKQTVSLKGKEHLFVWKLPGSSF